MSLACAMRDSPNHDARPDGRAADMLVLHYTGKTSAAAALERLCDPAAKVSSHWFVDEDGTTVGLVDESRRAWHAGVASWGDETDINGVSIGIEIVNPGHEFGYRDFPDRQIDAVIALCADILSRRDIPAARVLAHSDVAPLRKTDPGERFPWRRLSRAGIGHWVAPAPIVAGSALAPGDTGEDVVALQRDLARYGYGVGQGGAYDRETAAVVTAFQRHFRPARVDGIADFSTRDTLTRLLADPSAP